MISRVNKKTPSSVDRASTVNQRVDQFLKFEEPLDHPSYLEFVNIYLVPFVDIQDVFCDPPVVRGAGVFYKSFGDSGGYIAPRIYSFDPYF